MSNEGGIRWVSTSKTARTGSPLTINIVYSKKGLKANQSGRSQAISEYVIHPGKRIIGYQMRPKG